MIRMNLRKRLTLTAALLLLICGSSLSRAEMSNAEVAIGRAIFLLDSNQPAQALDAVKQALVLDPKAVEAHLLYIRLMTGLGRRAEVEGEYKEKWEKRKDGMSLMLYGRTLSTTDKMMGKFRESLELDPGLGWAHYCIASIQAQQGKLEDAAASLREGIRIQPGFVQAMRSLGTLYVGIGKLDLAESTFEDALEQKPDDAQVLFQLGSVLGKKGELERGVSYLEKARELAPQNLQIMNNLGFIYLKMKRYDDSIAMYDKVLEIDPNNKSASLTKEVSERVKKGEVRYAAVELMEKAMDATTPEEAIAAYRRVIEANPKFDLPYLALAQLLAATGKAQDAEKAFLYALELNPSSVEAARMLAEFYMVAGSPEKAEPYLLQALRGAPDSPELLATLGTVYANTGRPGKAEESFRKAVDLLPPSLELPSRFNLARSIIAQGRLEEGAAMLREILKLVPSFPEGWAELAACYFVMEDFDRALESVDKALELNPKSEELANLEKAIKDRSDEYARKSVDHLRARQIMVKTQAEAEDVLKELKSGASFEMLARKRSIGPEASEGGDIGFFKKGELMPELEKAVLALKPGETSGIVKTRNGYHIIRRLN